MLITNPGGEIAVVHTLTFESAEQRRQFHAYANTPDGLPVAYSGNIIVSAFEAIDKENQLVVVSAWKSEEIFKAYRQMRRDTAPPIVQPFLIDDVMVQSRVVDSDQRARI